MWMKHSSMVNKLHVKDKNVFLLCCSSQTHTLFLFTFAERRSVVRTLVTNGTVFALTACQQHAVMSHFNLLHPEEKHTHTQTDTNTAMSFTHKLDFNIFIYFFLFYLVQAD